MNADFFKCGLCTAIVEVQNTREEVLVAYDKSQSGWRIICDGCAEKLGVIGTPYMRISYDLLKEKVSHGTRN